VEQVDIERLAGGPPRLAYEDIVRHPRLAEARLVYLDRFLALYEGDPFTVRLLIESGRFLVYHVAGMLDASADPARRETWLTTKRLKQEMTQFGLASDRHIDGLIARLCSTGFMERRPAARDRRVRILKPTEKLRRHDQDWLAAHVAPLAVLYPKHDYGPIFQHDKLFHARYRRISMSFLPLGATLLLSLPDTMLFFNHAAGAVLQAALLRAAMAAPDYPNATVSFGEIGERLGVSRTHVRRLLATAEAADLVRLHGRGGRGIEILPRHWLSYDQGLAAGMYIHDLVYLATERAGRLEQASEGEGEVEGEHL
jgi:DNA-binding MarR family transcriptional regulator